jgi:hypothetical protein
MCSDCHNDAIKRLWSSFLASFLATTSGFRLVHGAAALGGRQPGAGVRPGMGLLRPGGRPADLRQADRLQLSVRH